MQQCRACRCEVPDASRVCPSCGVPLNASEVETRRVLRQSPRAPSTSSIDNARFIPGTILVSRYRIVSLVGRGGMGEVYRADDLKLGQRVALKFLPERVALDPESLARFHREVSVARQVSHPNVCRVHDIGEADGQHFLSMEYVDGEDLASLLRRIGRLPADKAVQVARQLCAGLAAAHERGVMHRDLKPGNVLLDAHGRVRIADFGLAALADDRREAQIFAGTPAYMAPEQLDGRGASLRSDLYALGLILYEIFTGRRVLNAAAREGERAASAGFTRAANGSGEAVDLDPVIERVIWHCLEVDPTERPASALAVAAALPGGDPLAAALAAGETPSPEMVAAAGDPGAISPAVGLACLAVILTGLLAVAWTSRQTTLIGVVGIDKEPLALAERARTIARTLGYNSRPVDEAYAYQSEFNALKYVAEHDRSAGRWEMLRTGRPPGITFWYRQSPRPLASLTFTFAGTGQVSYDDPPPTAAGMLSMRLDPAGRLLQFSAVPSPTSEHTTEGRSYDWSRPFVEAGLSMATFSVVESTSAPHVYADTRAAWTGAYPDGSGIPIRVEAAAARGTLVSFEVFAPWSQASSPELLERSGLPVAAVAMLEALLLVSSGLLIRRALRQGRGDRRGAFRLAVFIFIGSLVSDAVGAHHATDFGLELNLLVMFLALAIFRAAFVWLLYVVLESQVRRIWPETMIGWSRLLAGRVRDPLVGRDIVFGLCSGVVLLWVVRLASLVPHWLGVPGPILGVGREFIDIAPGYLPIGIRQGFHVLVMEPLIAVFGATGFAVLLVFFKALMRSRKAAFVTLTLVLAALFSAQLAGRTSGVTISDLMFPALGAAINVFVLVRFGLLASTAAMTVSLLSGIVPITLDWSTPYAESSYLTLAALLTAAIYGFYTALGGRPIFEAAGLIEPASKLPT
jgi:serine/threonine-protein kinase